MITPSEIRKQGIMIRPNEIPDTIRFGLRTKLLITPVIGSALTGCQVIYHKPGDAYPVHLHPITEDVVIVFRGKGEAFMGDAWYEVREGDVIYAPEYVKHGTRNPAGNTEEFICYNWQVPYIGESQILPGAVDQVFEDASGKVFSYGERGRFDVRIPGTGFIDHMDRGALFVDYGAPMRFVVWPGMGARKISLHRAKHPPGFEFHVHIHPNAEDTILAFRGNGQGYLLDRWIDMNEGDVLHAPRGVKHGTRNHNNTGDDFICTGAAAPPQEDLYKIAGYL